MESNFTRPNTSSEQRHQDYIECVEASMIKFPVDFEIVEPAHWTIPETKCETNPQNSKVECEIKPMEWVPAKYEDINFSNRKEALITCLQLRGYHRNFFPTFIDEKPAR
jgi:hypothetical protein